MLLLPLLLATAVDEGAGPPVEDPTDVPVDERTIEVPPPVVDGMDVVLVVDVDVDVDEDTPTCDDEGNV